MLSVMHPQEHFQRLNEEDFTLYPDPPTSMDISTRQLPPEAYGTYQSPMTQEMLSGMNPMGFDAWTDAQPAIFGQVSSPSIPSASDEVDPLAPSSNLSSGSAPSVSSSVAGSPLSYHGQLASMGEWQQTQGNLSIVSQDYYPGTEYQAYAPGIEDFPQFEIALNKPRPGFGEFQNVISGSQQQRNLSLSSPTATVVPSEPGLEPDLASPVSSAAPPSRRSSLAFVPVTPTSVSLSSPQAQTAQCSFFSQSSGSFVAPLESSYPAILHPDMRMPIARYEPPFQPQASVYPPPSPAMSSSPQPPAHSPYANGFPQQFHGAPFHPTLEQRRPSVVSGSFSVISHEQPSHSGDESGKEKQRCADCGKVFKDLRAHTLTHMAERPEKCPIATCDYHVKGFARKYDKNRHTLTHYKGTMVCGFCPGAAEKSFNRADVFKRHLMTVHGVEQSPPNSRKKTSAVVNGGERLTNYADDATGKCSTCSATFSNAQDFYEHLDDCVIRSVQQEDPAEAINAKRLAEVENDKSVMDTLEKNHLPTTPPSNAPALGEEDVEMVVEEDDEEARKSPVRKMVKMGPANGIQKSKGLTHSRGGVSLSTKGRARKKRREYPSSWGFDKGQMTTRKRVVAVFDGPRRLAKDDMMLSTEHEVRVKLSDGKSYVTDLDVQTMKRAEGFHQATEEEKGPWISDDPTEEDVQTMFRMQQQQQQQKQQQQQQ